MKDAFQKEKEERKRQERTVKNCPFRTTYHIMPPVGWINDPNGLCQFKGKFHAYFQYSPLSVHGGGGYWGHCISRDLLQWEYQDPPLAADIPEDRNGVYSGSALIEDGEMYLFYTGNVKLPGDYDYIDAGRISTQLLVESEDGQHMSAKEKLLGMEDYPQDITQHVRDPKVWKEDGVYYMVLGARARAWREDGSRRDKGGVLIYSSPDKRHWSLFKELVPEKAFGYMWECPDIFQLEGQRVLSFCPQGVESQAEKFQNIYQSGYWFMDESENPQDTFREWDMGFDFYAPQTFQSEDGRRILIGWAGVPDTERTHRNLSVENGWQHCLTIPTELTFREGQIFRMPVRELYQLNWKKTQMKDGSYNWENCTVKLRITEMNGEPCQIRVGTERNILTINVEKDRVELSFLDSQREAAVCGGGRGKRVGRTHGSVDKLLVLIDSSIVEIFVNDGELVFTTRIYLQKQERILRIQGEGSRILEVIEKA